MSTTKAIERVEAEMRAAARRRGMTMKELAARMGVSKGYLSQIATGKKHWTPKMREKVIAVLGEVPGQGTVHVRQEAVDGESTYIRERARELGLTMRDLAASAGVTKGHLSQVSRGHRIMSVSVQARVEAALEAPAEVASSERAGTNIQALWDRMNAHDISQNKVAKQAGITSGHLSSIMSGKRNPSPTVLRKLHAVLFQPSKAELRVMPAEVKVLGWRKGERSGMVTRDDGGQTAPHRWTNAARRGRRIRLPHRLRRHRAHLRPPRCPTGVFGVVDAEGGGCRLVQRWKEARGPTKVGPLANRKSTRDVQATRNLERPTRDEVSSGPVSFSGCRGRVNDTK